MESVPEVPVSDPPTNCTDEAMDMETATDPPANSTDDAFAYLNTDRFTSEKFKIEVRGLPKRYGIGELRKLLKSKLQLDCCKIKPPTRNGGSWLYLTFRSEDEKQKAIVTLDGFVWKNRKLTARPAAAVADPYFAKRKTLSKEALEKQKLAMLMSPDELIKNSTVPLWNMPYEQQLESKVKYIKAILDDLKEKILHDNKHSKAGSWLEERCKQNNDSICEVTDVRHVPLEAISKGYRNKCEFSIGINEATGLKTVGFRYGAYVEGSTSVGSVAQVPHVPDRMKEVVKVFEQFVQKSELPVFSPVQVKGFWKQLTVRLGMNTGELMVVVAGNADNVTSDQLAQTKKDIVELFAEQDGKSCNVTSLYFQNISTQERSYDMKSLELLDGAPTITEVLNGLKFSISPFSFFQIHTAAAEILYNSVAELIPSSKKVTLLDICCGTGSIGLCLSKKCDQVIGVESEPSAIENAKINCKQNNIENCEFHLGRAEDILPSIIPQARNEEIIAIVDPPRNGLHKKAISSLRRTSGINKIIYMSCSPKAALVNFIDLGRRPSKTLLGAQFFPTMAIPVDNFPHTNHSELILVFERYNDTTQQNNCSSLSVPVVVVEPPNQCMEASEKCVENDVTSSE